MDICFTHVCDCPADRKGELKALAFRETKAQATQDHQLIGSRQGLSVHGSGNQDFGVTRGPFHVQRWMLATSIFMCLIWVFSGVCGKQKMLSNAKQHGVGG